MLQLLTRGTLELYSSFIPRFLVIGCFTVVYRVTEKWDGLIGKEHGPKHRSPHGATHPSNELCPNSWGRFGTLFRKQLTAVMLSSSRSVPQLCMMRANVKRGAANCCLQGLQEDKYIKKLGDVSASVGIPEVLGWLVLLYCQIWQISWKTV